jgi:phenylpropionate dioxygenase-like ring-hydroxylating dioxygenase large terminal subunit
VVATESSLDRYLDTSNGILNNAIFSHPDVYAQEMEQIFARMWLFVGHESQIPNPGDFVRSRMGEEQVIVTRAPDRKIYVLLNSCAHRGNVVCRYDQGFGLAFQCSFHGWTYNSKGELTALPPGSEELYAADLHKEDWGLLRARVETFHGTIWATWDESAPSLVEYFGGMGKYLEVALSTADGTPGGTEVAGGVMKWRVGLNWKVPMPDNDNTHGWITHRSARGPVAGFNTNGVGGTNTRTSYHVWFPDGHTTSMSVPEGDDDEWERRGGLAWGGVGDDYPVLRDYWQQHFATRKARLAKLAGFDELPHIFPNMGSVGRIIRVLHPQGPTETEMWSFILVDMDAPPEVKEAAVRYHEGRWGPNGLIQKDDMENWFILTQYSKGLMTRTRLRQNAQLAMSRPSLDGPSTFGLPGNFAETPTDENIRRFYGHWSRVMQARDWDEILASRSAR